MKRNLRLFVSGFVPVLAFVFVVSLPVLLSQRASAAESKPRIVGVDYVLALMDAGIDQKEIIHRIEEKNLAFRLAPGDVDRLREAGAGKNLIEVVTSESAVLENHEGAPSSGAPAPQDQRGNGSSQWGRPSRLGTEGSAGTEGPGPDATQAPSPTSEDDQAEYNNGEGIEEEPYGGYGGYGGYGAYPDYDYWTGYYGFVYSYGYPYPYYYYPRYYYPYRSYYFSAPYYSYPRHSFRSAPRGGGFRGGWHGGGGGGTPRSSPRGGSGSRPAPRGSHH